MWHVCSSCCGTTTYFVSSHSFCQLRTTCAPAKHSVRACCVAQLLICLSNSQGSYSWLIKDALQITCVDSM